MIAGEESIPDVIIRTISRNELPRTHYIATLILIAIRNNKLTEIVNEATLVQNFIDVVLKKHEIGNIFRGPTDFIGLSKLLTNLALWLNEQNGYASENILLEKISKFYTERGIPAGAGAVLNHFVDAGIFERVGDDIGFRYPVIQSFLLAHYANSDNNFTDMIFSGRKVVSPWMV